MAEQAVNWSSGDLVSRTKQQNMSDDAVNDIDNIHKQYIGITLYDGKFYALQTITSPYTFGYGTEAGSRLIEIDTNKQSVAIAGVANSVSYKVTNDTSIDVAFDLKTFKNTIGTNYLELRVTKQVNDGGNLEVLVNTYVSPVDDTWETFDIPLVYATDLSALNISEGDYLMIMLGMVVPTAGRYVFCKGLKVIRTFA